MLCAPINGLEEQVWPGNAIDIYSASARNIRLSVVSTYSSYLNFERWYLSTTPNATWGDDLLFRHAATRPRPSSDTPPDAAFTESYIDRAVVTDLDWRAYHELPPPPPGYELQKYATELTPVRIVESSPTQTRIVVGDPVMVWLRFWQLGGELVQVQWYWGGKVNWHSPVVTGTPSAFAMPDDGARFRFALADALPSSGLVYSGGLRPGPWPT